MAMSPRLLRPRATGFNPKSISGLAAWYDAADASTLTISTGVSTWADKSGNGRTLRQNVGNSQPSSTTRTLNGKPVLEFDGANDSLTYFPANGSNSTPTYDIDITSARAVSMFCVCASDNTGVDQGLIQLTRSGTNTNDGGSWFWRRATSTRFEMAAGRGDAANDALAANFIRAFSDNVTSANIYSGVISAASDSLTIEKNGVNQSLITRYGSGSAGNFLSQGSGNHALDIGCGRAGAGVSNFWDGVIGEVLIYTRAVSAAERQRITRYLGAKWGITV